MTTSEQALRFLIVGGIATAIHYVVLIAIVQSGLSGPVVASTTGFTISAVFNYAANRCFTFRSAARHGRAFPRFISVALVGLALNAAFMGGLHGWLQWHYLVAQVIATAITLCWNFAFNKLWTFAE